MKNGSYFEIKPDLRRRCIDEYIIEKLDVSDKEDLRKKVEGLIRDYEGWDRDALTILVYATEKGCFSKYFEELDHYYKRNLVSINPEERKQNGVQATHRTKVFFGLCYRNLAMIRNST